VSLDDGTVCRVVGPASNYQGIGRSAAENVWSSLVKELLERFGATLGDVAAAGLGIAGFDRPRDEAVIKAGFDKVLPGIPHELVNDTYLVLRAGTPDGVGVAVVSGTGCNAVGQKKDGERFRVGGLGPDFGDLGSATDIAIEGLRAAFRSLDGRAPETLLSELIVERLNLERLDDLVDFSLADGANEGYSPGMLAPLVFEAAGRQDRVCGGILQWAGKQLAISVNAVARRLFAPDEAFTLVMGGAVLQRGSTRHLVDALVADVTARFRNVRPVIIEEHPVAGAVFYALDVFLSMGAARHGDKARRLCAEAFPRPVQAVPRERSRHDAGLIGRTS